MRKIVLAASAAVALGLSGPASGATINYVEESIGVSGGTQGGLEADCADGERALGGGILSTGNYDTSDLNASYPTDGPDSNERSDDAWRAYIDAYDLVSITVKVACVGGNPTKNLKYRDDVARVPKGATKALRVGCPRGYKVTSGGVSNSGVFEQAELKTSRPVDGNTSWEGAIRNLTSHRLKIFVSAVCARGSFAKGLAYRQKTREADPDSQAAALSNCPVGGTAVGGGVRVKGALSNVNTNVINVSSSISYVDATGGNPVEFTNYLICHG